VARYAYTWGARPGRLPTVEAVSINAARHKGARPSPLLFAA